MSKISAIVYTSEDLVATLNAILPLTTFKIPVVVVGPHHTEVCRALGCDVYSGGNTFKKYLVAGLRKVKSDLFLFLDGRFSLSNIEFLDEAAELLNVPDVGFVVPSLIKSAGPQSYKRKEKGPISKIAPWCFVGRTQESLRYFESVTSKFSDVRVVMYVSYLMMREGKFSHVIPKYTLEQEGEAKVERIFSDQIKEKLHPVLLFRSHQKGVAPPSEITDLFERVEVCSLFDIPKFKTNELVFILKEGESFGPNLTKSLIDRLCYNPDPFVFAYQFPILKTWDKSHFLVNEVTWEVRAFQALENTTARVLVNPFYFQQLPYECLRTTSVPILKAISNKPETGTVASLKHPTLTIATIMKDEMKNLPTYLSAALPFAAEIILVDTGSSDESKEFALKYNCKVIEADLNKNFSGARNRYLKDASSQWLLHQDLDEIVDYKQIYLMLLKVPVVVDGIQLSVHNLTPQEGTVVFQDALRLIQNPKTWFYSNRVHETLERCATELGKQILRTSDIIIYHLGFLSPRMKEKLAFYKELTTLQLEEEPENPLPYFNLALDLLNDTDEHPENFDVALELLHEAVKLQPSFSLAQYELSRIYCTKALFAIDETLKWVPPDHPMIRLIKAIYKPLKEYTERYIIK